MSDDKPEIITLAETFTKPDVLNRLIVIMMLSTDLERAGATVVSQLTPTGQPWPMTAGLVRLSLVSIETPAHTDYEGEL